MRIVGSFRNEWNTQPTKWTLCDPNYVDAAITITIYPTIHSANQPISKDSEKRRKWKTLKWDFPFEYSVNIIKFANSIFNIFTFCRSHIPISYTFTQAIILIFALQPNDFHDIQIEHKQGNFTSTSLSFGVRCHTFAQFCYGLTCFAFYALKQRTYNVSKIKKSLLFESFFFLQAFLKLLLM